jgi:DNA polymerase-3 subunit delta'
MTFAGIVGHTRQIAVLRRAVASGRLHHAYLLVGPEGVGKRRVAEALAMAAMCERPADGEGCGACGSCRRFLSGNHPDLVAVAPPEPGDDGPRTAATRKRRTIKVDDIHAVRALTRFAPSEGRRRAILIDDAEDLGEAAAGALLKILEEPPAGTLFLLVTGRPMALLPTIHSRCQSVHFGPLADADVAEVVARALGPGEETAAWASGIAGGSPGRVLAMDLGELAEARRRLISGLARLDGQGTVAAFAFAEEILALPLDLPDACALLVSFYRDAAVHRTTGGTGRLLHADLAGEIAAVAARLSMDRLRRDVAAVDRVVAGQRHNQNRQLAVEGLALELAGPAPNAS